MTNEIILESTITCPECNHQTTEHMHTGSCQFFYESTSCQTVLRPKEGDCCVFCSYGDVKCPSVQQGNKSCC